MSDFFGSKKANTGIMSSLGLGSTPQASRGGGFFDGIGQRVRQRGSVILLSIVTFLILLGIVVYLVYKFRQTSLQAVLLVDKPLKLYGMREPRRYSGERIPTASTGQAFTYSMWLYLVDYDDISSEHRLVMLRNTDEDIKGANPIVFMDGRTNRLYVSLRTNMSNGSISDLSDLVPENLASSSKKFLTATVEYVPLQRWVNISVVVQDNLMTLYLEGELYTVRNVHDLWDRSETKNRPIISGSSGNVYVGPTEQHKEGVRGFISNLKFFNYAAMQDDITANYLQGPVYKSWSSSLGWEQKYGLQSPIYKLDDK